MRQVRKVLLYGLMLLLIPVTASAQVIDTQDTSSFNEYLRSGDEFNLGVQPYSLFDPSRMTFSHSVSSSYLSSGGEGVMRNLFMETIGYRISNPLRLTLNLGYLQTPYSSFDQNSTFTSGSFVGSAALTWRPTENMFLHFEVARMPGYGYGYYPYNSYMPRYHLMDSPETDLQPRSSGLSQGE